MIWRLDSVVLFLLLEIATSKTMKKTYIIFAALALTLCSCGGNNNQTQNEPQQPVASVEEPAQTYAFQDIVPSDESVLYAKGDLNKDGIEDVAVVAKNEVLRNEEIEPVKGDGLRIYFGDSDGGYTLSNTCAVNSRPDEFFSDWQSLSIDKEGNLVVEEVYATDGETIQTYVMKFMDNDFYHTDYSLVYGVDDDNVVHYDLLNKTAVVDVDWHEMDTEIYHHRTDTYALKDQPLKKLSDFSIGDEVCSFDEYVEDDGLSVFEYSGSSKEELCSEKCHPTYEEGDLDGDGDLDLVVNALNATFAVYYMDNGTYRYMFQGKRCDKNTQTDAYIEEGNVIVNANSESSMAYVFHDNGYGYYRLNELWLTEKMPNGESKNILVDLVNCKKSEWMEGESAVPADFSNCSPKVFEEFHFGDMREIRQLLGE